VHGASVEAEEVRDVHCGQSRVLRILGGHVSHDSGQVSLQGPISWLPTLASCDLVVPLVSLLTLSGL